VARDILKKFGIDINAAENGINVPANMHRGKGLHSYAGIDKVTRELRAAKTQAQAEAILKSIAERIAKGKFL
jgi:hypothetical protein